MIRIFFAGMFLFNSVPHLIKGISGDKHMTPFKRVSSPIVNVLWGFSNLVLFVVFLGFDPVTQELNRLAGVEVWVFLVGGLVMALMNANLFGRPNAKLPWHKG